MRKPQVTMKGLLYQPTDLGGREPAGHSVSAREGEQPLSDVIGMQLTILSEHGGMKNILLPWPPKGTYYFDSIDTLHLGKYLSVREAGGKWVAHCVKPAYFKNDSGKIFYEMELLHGAICRLENVGETYALFTEFSNRKSNIFHNYRADRFTDITIGRTSENDIQYANSFVSRHHAILRWEKNDWSIRDDGSSNGLYVNNMRVEKAALAPGDSVFIMGLRINVGIGFISINDENGRVRFSSKLRRITADDRNLLPEKPYLRERKEELFNRLPRKREALNPEPIIIEAPPMQINDNGIPLVLRMGGSMVMSSMALLAGNITSMISSVFFPVLTQRYTKKQKDEYEAKRREKYGKYLEEKNALIEGEVRYEKRVLEYNYQSLSKILSYAEDGKRLWERRKVDDDFLEIRIGYGRIPMLAERRYPERRFEMDEDELLDRMYELAERPVFLENAPIMTSLTQDYVCGVTGDHDIVIGFVKRLIMQLTILHSYDEVKLVVLSGEEDLKSISFVRYLPHIWNDQRGFRFLASTAADASQISEYLKAEIGEDVEKPRELKDILKRRSYYIVIAFSKKVFDSMEILKDVMQCDKNCGVTVITAFDELPKECMKIFRLSRSGDNSVVHLNQIDLADDSFFMDDYDQKEAINCMKKISNTSLRVVSQAYSLPKMVTFLEMFGVGNVEQLNPLKRWEENNPIKSLSTPIGIATDGSLFTLDLHEKFQGPHGLIAGMTGSGKSEFIITYILSMAVSYNPDEVAFILIDYKGGGLAGAFEDPARGLHLPHLVGTITNLDGAAIRRSMMALQSELLRRQRLFNEAKSIANEGTMDIYGYQKLYRTGKVKEPLPHLFVISDEFAELKAQEPDFMDNLVSTARIGRSLGVHLILATQKPSGVVNDQISSNAKFRVCLKVQTRADSDEMLRRPEAAEIRDTGRFYLQVGYNEFFALGQSAWCGADYEPQEEVIVHRDESVQLIDLTGQEVASAKPEIAKDKTDVSQLVAIVKYLSEIAQLEKLEPRQLWTDPLAEKIQLQSLRSKHKKEENETYKIVIGLIDDPENQRQYPLVLDFMKIRNLMIVGTGKTGKTTLIESILFALTEKQSPEDVNIYVIDYSSRMLKVFGSTPHCGGSWGEGDEKDVEKFFSLLQEIIDERKKMLAKAMVSSFEVYRETKRIPLVFVVIDNITGLSSWNGGEAISRDLALIIREGSSAGIRFIISAGAYDDVRYQVKKEFDTRIALSASSKFEFSDIVGAKCEYEPGSNPGRGLCKVGEDAREVQIARLFAEKEEKTRVQDVLSEIERISTVYKSSCRAKRIKKYDEKETYEEFYKDIETGRIPLGYSVTEIKKISMPLRQLYCMSVYFGNPDGKTMILRNLVAASIREDMHLLAICSSDSSAFETEEIQTMIKKEGMITTLLSTSEEDSDRFTDIMIEEITMRKQFRNEYCEANHIPTSSADAIKKSRDYIRDNTYPLLILIENYAEFCKTASERCQQCMQQMMANGKGYNFYIVAGYTPEDDRNLSINSMYTGFNPDHFILLFGGQFQKQYLINLPMEYRRIEKPSQQYNSFLMQYRGNLYPLVMPCGDLKRKTGNPDDEDIMA